MTQLGGVSTEPIENLSIGKVIEVDGSSVIAELDSDISDLSRIYAGEAYPIGQFGSIIRIHFGRTLIYGMVGRLRMKADYEAEKGIEQKAREDERIVEAELFGEGRWYVGEEGENRFEFERGVSTYPLPLQTVYLTPNSELRWIYGESSAGSIRIGTYVGNTNAPCYANMNELLGKHSAVLGSTGSGKSGAVAAILHRILEHGETMDFGSWNPRIIILDPHNEYSAAFDEHQRLSTDDKTLALPYWLLNLEETIELILGKAEYAATSQANIIKNALAEVRCDTAERVLGIDSDGITVDSPIPYDLGDPSQPDEFGVTDGALYDEGLVGAINRQRPDGRDKKRHDDFNKVLRKLETLCRDDRLQFMMERWAGANDTLPEVLGQLIGTGARIRIVDLSAVPNEVAGTATAVIARMLFAVKVWQTPEEREESPVLAVCEEAHRYVPNRGEAFYKEAQAAIRRIAKEGRKYGLSIMLVSQRPSEVETTVLSQCNSWLVLRTTNHADREHVRGVLPDSMAGLEKMLSGLRKREAIFVGQAAVLPSRVLVTALDKEKVPRSADIDFERGWQNEALSEDDLVEIGKRWRYQRR